jgi:uncharacterized protein YebE (UPF0316 family)
MHIQIYLSIFFLKLLENALGTIRMIIATNGNKLWGAILQFLIGIVWVMSASLAITNIQNDPLKILVFAFGSAIGSYVGCVIEAKMAIGKNIFLCITKEEQLLNVLHESGFSYTTLLGSGMKEATYVILIAIPRKVKKKLLSIIQKTDENAMIISESSDFIYGGRKNLIY